MNIEDITYIILTPCVESYFFDERKIHLPYKDNSAIIIGRNIGNHVAKKDNAIFHCKVLSRNHACIWNENGICYIQDTNSSNGTYLNGVQLHSSNSKCFKKRLYTGDIIQFGVEIVDFNNKVVSQCIIAYVKFANKYGVEIDVTEHKPLKNNENKISKLSSNNRESQQIFELQQFVKEVVFRENILTQKLEALEEALLATTKAAEASWSASINEESLLPRIQKLEHKVATYSNKYPIDPLQKNVKDNENNDIDITYINSLKRHKEFEEKMDKKLQELDEKINKLDHSINVINDKLNNHQKIIDNNEVLVKLNKLSIKEINNNVTNVTENLGNFKRLTDQKILDITTHNILNYKNEHKNHFCNNKNSMNYEDQESQSESVNSIIPCIFQNHKNVESQQYGNKNKEYHQKIINETSEFSDGSSSSLSPYIYYNYTREPKKKKLIYRFSSISERSYLGISRKLIKKRQKRNKKRKLKVKKSNKRSKISSHAPSNTKTVTSDFSFDVR
uniref:FHA domain-containing protein n=1 Tax=Parastrongyloides trichosuri TaxID=131310 RepID=A0A0N4ZCP5_PARTI